MEDETQIKTEIKKLICDSCHCEIEEGEENIFDDIPYCETCFDDQFFCCSMCEESSPEGESHSIYDTRYNRINVCENCFENHTGYCEGCGEYVHEDIYHGNSMCNSCYEESEDYNNESGFEEQTFDGVALSNKLGRYKEHTSGVEIELYCEENDNLIYTIGQKVNQRDFTIGFKTDGSLHDQNGIEIVTPPMYGKAIDTVINGICDSIEKCNGFVNTDCGLHVHIDSQKLDDRKLY